MADLHAQLLVERGKARALILEAPDRRDELLDTPGTDAAIRKLDRDVATAHLTLERLDRAEPTLIRQIQARHEETREAAWLELRSRVIPHLSKLAFLRNALTIAEMGVLEFKNEANRGGFDFEMQAVPWPPDMKFMVTGAQWASLAQHLATFHYRPPPPAVKLWNVRFTQWAIHAPPNGDMAHSTAYLSGQEAGFTADVAWALVDSGVAEWPTDDPKLIPPKPPKPRKRKRAPATVLQLDNIQGAPVVGSESSP